MDPFKGALKGTIIGSVRSGEDPGPAFQAWALAPSDPHVLSPKWLSVDPHKEACPRPR